jgi:hypothetical protein
MLLPNNYQNEATVGVAEAVHIYKALVLKNVYLGC